MDNLIWATDLENHYFVPSPIHWGNGCLQVQASSLGRSSVRTSQDLVSRVSKPAGSAAWIWTLALGWGSLKKTQLNRTMQTLCGKFNRKPTCLKYIFEKSGRTEADVRIWYCFWFTGWIPILVTGWIPILVTVSGLYNIIYIIPGQFPSPSRNPLCWGMHCAASARSQKRELRLCIHCGK